MVKAWTTTSLQQSGMCYCILPQKVPFWGIRYVQQHAQQGGERPGFWGNHSCKASGIEWPNMTWPVLVVAGRPTCRTIFSGAW